MTIFGESGGGAKVSMLLAMPAAKGLFHKAIIQSGPGVRAMTAERATASARALLSALSIEPGDLAGLSSLPVETIHAAAASLAGKDTLMSAFSPCVDGVALPRHPFEPDAPATAAAVPVMIGTNKDETTLFEFTDPKFGELTEADLAKRAKAAAGDKAEALVAALREIYPDYSPTYLASAARTATMFWIDSVNLAQRKAAQDAAPAYMYQLAWETPAARGRLKCPHALEIPLVFDNVEAARSFVGRGDEPRKMAELMAPAGPGC